MGGEVYPIEFESNSKEGAFTPFFTWIGESFNNVDGGLERGRNFQSLLEFGFDSDLESAFGWEGAKLHASGLWLRGDSDSLGDLVGDFGGISNVAGIDRVRLFRFFYEQELLDGDLLFKVGQLALDDDFMTSDQSALFLNSNFGAIPTLSGNVGTPIYPLGSLGLQFKYEPDELSYLQFGIYDGDAGSEEESERGFNFDLGRDEGLAFIVEASRKIGGSFYRVGGYLHTGDFTEFATGETVRGTHSFYVRVDHAWQSGIDGFVRFGYNPNDDRDAVIWTADAGLVGPGFAESHQWGLGFTYIRFSDDFTEASSASGTRASNEEAVIEWTYRAQFGEHFAVQPDIQYVIDPQRARGRNALVLGLRVETSF